MTLIKIDRSSIKKNPDGGKTQSHVIIGSTTTFVCNEIPNRILDLIQITSENIENGVIEYSGFIKEPFDYEKFKGVKGLKVNTEINNQFIRHLPEPYYFYDYENTEVKCNECGKMIGIKEVYYDDECPNCNGIDSFGLIEYEKFIPDK